LKKGKGDVCKIVNNSEKEDAGDYRLKTNRLPRLSTLCSSHCYGGRAPTTAAEAMVLKKASAFAINTTA